jgi:hypothetical protein
MILWFYRCLAAAPMYTFRDQEGAGSRDINQRIA